MGIGRGKGKRRATPQAPAPRSAPQPKQTGRPSTFTQEIADEICDGLASGKSLRKVCDEEGMPHRGTVLAWVRDDPDGFGAQYARARDLLYQHWAEDVVDISDDSGSDIIRTPDGKEITNYEVVARAKLRVDSRKWMLSKLLPKQYGEKLELGSDPDKPLAITSIERRIVHVKKSGD